jgi:hypothetical protein
MNRASARLPATNSRPPSGDVTIPAGHSPAWLLLERATLPAAFSVVPSTV